MEGSLSETSPLQASVKDSEESNNGNKRRYFTVVEAVVFITAVSLAALQITVQNFYINRICLYRLKVGENASICDNLADDHDREEAVEAEAATIGSYRTILEAGPPILFGLCWGQLNDKLGSKLPLMIPMIGFVLYPTMFLLLSNIKGIPPGFFLVASLPLGFMGGGVAYSVSGYKYIVSTTATSDRSFRMGTMDVAFQLGQPIGTVLGSQLYSLGGFHMVFVTCLVLESLAVLAVGFFLKNNEPIPSLHRNNIFSWQTALETMTSLFKKSSYRTHVVILTAINCLQVLGVTASYTVLFLYTRLTFQWEQQQYSDFMTVDCVAMAAAVAITAYFAFKVYNVSPYRVGLASAALCIASSLLWTFAKSLIVFFIGAALEYPMYMISIVVRAKLSLLVPATEIGKILSCVGLLESLVPIFFGPICNAIYVGTMSTFSSALFLISAGFYIIIFAAFSVLAILPQPSAEVRPF